MRVLRLAAACVALFCAPAHAQQGEQPGQAWGITQLMQTLAQVKSASGQFTERKTMRMLSEPLLASGTLLYLAPDQVQKITVLPQRERVAVRGDTVTIEGGQDERGRTLSLTDYSEIGGAPLLGVKGVCIITHGRSNANAIKNAIRVAAEFAGGKINERIEAELAHGHAPSRSAANAD